MESNQDIPFNVEAYKAALLAKYKEVVGAITTE
jgi:hypothetical protein